MATSLTRKLQLQPGQRLAVLHAPAGYRDRLAQDLPDTDLVPTPASPGDALLLFVNTRAEAADLAAPALTAAAPGALAWIAYPKGSSKVKTDVNRDTLWAALEPTGWRPVRQVALDEVWSAMRFRPKAAVGR